MRSLPGYAKECEDEPCSPSINARANSLHPAWIHADFTFSKAVVNRPNPIALILLNRQDAPVHGVEHQIEIPPRLAPTRSHLVNLPRRSMRHRIRRPADIRGPRRRLRVHSDDGPLFPKRPTEGLLGDLEGP